MDHSAKKICSLVAMFATLLCAMLLAAAPSSAWAESGAFKVGETEYASFNRALSAAARSEDSTITLTGDVTVDSSLTINRSDITLDLDGHTLTITSSDDGISVTNGASGVKITSSAEDQGTIYLDSTATGKSVICVTSGSVSELSNVDLRANASTSDYGIYLYSENASMGAISGCTFSDVAYGIAAFNCSPASTDNEGNLTAPDGIEKIEDTAITASVTGIELSRTACGSIDGCTITGGTDGILVKSRVAVHDYLAGATISSSTISGTSGYGVEILGEGSGAGCFSSVTFTGSDECVVTGGEAAVYVDESCDLTLESGGIVCSASDEADEDAGEAEAGTLIALAGAEDAEDGESEEVESAGVVVKGGTFAMSGGTISGYTSEYGGGVYVEDGTFAMSGGTICDNHAYYGGGAYLASEDSGSSFTMTGGTITHNEAEYQGGGVYLESGSGLVASDAVLANNEAGDKDEGAWQDGQREGADILCDKGATVTLSSMNSGVTYEADGIEADGWYYDSVQLRYADGTVTECSETDGISDVALIAAHGEADGSDAEDGLDAEATAGGATAEDDAATDDDEAADGESADDSSAEDDATTDEPDADDSAEDSSSDDAATSDDGADVDAAAVGTAAADDDDAVTDDAATDDAADEDDAASEDEDSTSGSGLSDAGDRAAFMVGSVAVMAAIALASGIAALKCRKGQRS